MRNNVPHWLIYTWYTCYASFIFLVGLCVGLALQGISVNVESNAHAACYKQAQLLRNAGAAESVAFAAFLQDPSVPLNLEVAKGYIERANAIECKK